MNKIRKITIQGLTFLMLLTLIVVNPKQNIQLYADEFGPYYNVPLNKKNIVEEKDELSQKNIALPKRNAPSDLTGTTMGLEGFIEDSARRDAYTKVYANHETGEEKIVYYLEPIHELVNGVWEDIDLKFEENKQRSDNQKFSSETTYRSITVSNDKASLDTIGTVELQNNIVTVEDEVLLDNAGPKVISTNHGLVVRQETNSESVPVSVQLEDNVRAEISETDKQVNLYDKDNKIIGIVSPRGLTDGKNNRIDEPVQVEAINQDGRNLEIKFKIPETLSETYSKPFNVDVEMEKTANYGKGDVLLFGVRSGELYRNHSYNPGSSWASEDRVITGNANYNYGSMLGGTSTQPLESIDNRAILYFHNGKSMTDIIGAGRVVKNASFTTKHNTGSTAVSPNGVKFHTYMLDPEKHFDINNVDAITYNNYMNYLNNSNVGVRGTGEVNARGAQDTTQFVDMTFDITNIVQSWQNSGTHHGIEIRGVSNADDGPLESSIAIFNHRSDNAAGSWQELRPSVTITTIKEEPISPTLPLEDSVLFMRPFTSNDRKNNVVHFGALGFDAMVRPGSTLEVEIQDSANSTLFNSKNTALTGYRKFSQYTKELGYNLVSNAQTYYRLTSNVQVPEFFYNSTSLKKTTPYTVRYRTSDASGTSKWKSGDTFIIYKSTGYDRISRLLAFYGVSDKEQFMRDNNLSDELLVASNEVIIRNPTKNQTKQYQPSALSEADKRMIDADLLGRNQHCEYGYEPINLNTGNFLYDNPDVGYIENDKEHILSRHYDSMGLGKDGLFGRNWTMSISESLYFLENGTIQYQDSTGRIYTFVRNEDGTYKTPYGSSYQLNRSVSETRTFTRDSDYYDQDDAPISENFDVDYYQYELSQSVNDEKKIFNHYGDITEQILNKEGLKNTYTYDSNNNLSIYTSASGKKFSFEYNNSYYVSKITAPNGTSVQYGYDSDGNLTKYVDQHGFVIEYEYDTNHRMLSFTSREDGTKVVENVYDSEGRIESQKDALGNKSTFTYGNGYTEITDYKGNTERITVNSRGYTEKVEDKNGLIMPKEYDERGNLVSETKKDGKVYTYSYNSSNLLKSESNALGQTKSYSYDSQNNIIEVVDFDGNTVSYEYDDKNNLIRTNFADGTFSENRFENSLKVYSRDIYGLEKTYAYLDGNLTQVGYADGTTERYSYDALGFLVSETNRQGITKSYTYDQRGLLVSEGSGDRQTVYHYDGDGQKIGVTDPMGNNTVFVYDAWSRVISIENSLGKTYKTYDENGNQLTETNALNETTSSVYNHLDQKVKSIDAAGRETIYEYDTLGRNIKTTNSDGSENSQVFNVLGQLESSTKNERTTYYEYDTLGRQSKVIDYLGRESVNSYDGENRLIETIDSNGDKTQYQYQGSRITAKIQQDKKELYNYDNEGNKTSSLNSLNHGSSNSFEAGVIKETTLANGIKQYYEYNAYGEIAAILNERGEGIRYEYDKNGNVTRETDANGNITQKSYNAANLLVEEISPSGIKKAYAYDALGRRVETTLYDNVNNGEYVETKVYNVLGQIQEEIDTLGRSIKYTYDEAGRVIVTDKYGRKTYNEYDKYGRKIKESTITKTMLYEYNEKDQMIANSDSNGYRKTYIYNEKGQMIQSQDNRGKSTIHELDSLGNILSTTDERGLKIARSYNSENQLLSETDVYGNVTTYDVNEIGQVTRIKSDTKFDETLFDDIGMVSGFRDIINGESKIEQDSNGNVLSVTNDLEETIRFKYDAENRETKRIDALGNETSYEYDARDNQIKIIYPDGSTVQNIYDAGNRLIGSVDQLGFKTEYEYDIYDQQIKEIDALGNYSKTIYDDKGNVIEQIDSKGNTTRSNYNEKNQLIESVDASGNKSQYFYDSMDRKIKEIKPNGLEVITEYNEFGDVLSQGTGPNRNHDLVQDYDEYGRIVSKRDLTGIETRYEYDHRGNVIKTYVNGHLILESKYNEANLVYEEIDEHGLKSTISYDELSRQKRIEVSNGRFIENEFDANGNIISVTDNLGSIYYEYDSNSRLISETDRLGRKNIQVYNERSEVVENVDYRGVKTSTKYDELGRKILEIDELGRETRYKYDSQNLVAMEDAYGRYLEFEYDALGRETKVKLHKTVIRDTSYDEMGNVISIRTQDNEKDSYIYDKYGKLLESNESGALVKYEYDSKGQIVSKQSDDKINYGYDHEGNLTSVKNSQGETTMSYNQWGDVLSVTDENNKTIKYGYDENGHQNLIEYPSGKQVYKEIDAFGRILSVFDGTETIKYEYDAENQLLTSTNPLSKTSYSYSERHELAAQITTSTQDEAIIDEIYYNYDDAGNITNISYPKRDITQEYKYDKLDQIIEVNELKQGYETTREFTYDDHGNRTLEVINDADGQRTKRYVIGQNDQLLAVEDTRDYDITYKYDKNGNVTEKVYDNGFREQYIYNSENKMIRIENSDARIIEYTYDQFGNRNGKKDTYSYDSVVSTNRPSGDGESRNLADSIKHAKDSYRDSLTNEKSCTFTSLKDNEVTIEESYVLDLSMEYPSVVENYKNGKLTNSTVYSFEAAMHDTISETRYLVSNIKDDIVLNVGKKQNVQMYDYDFFGKPTSLLPQNLGYSGEVHDGAIQYLRARYYDTETGVFLTRDTYHGDSKDIGSQNRYTYVQNNPINRVDPSGHFFKNLWNSVVNTVSNVVSSVVDFGKSVVDFGRKVFNTVVNAVVQPIKSVYESVKEVGSTIYHSISSSSRSSNRNNVVNAPAPKIIKKTKLQLAIEAKQQVENTYQTSKQKLDLEIDEWRARGFTEEKIKAMKLEFIKKYCESLGLGSVETTKILEKHGIIYSQSKIDLATQEARKELNYLISNIYANHLPPYEYEQSKSGIIDSICQKYGLAQYEVREVHNQLKNVGYAEVPVGLFETVAGVFLTVVSVGAGVLAFAGSMGVLPALAITVLGIEAGFGTMLVSSVVAIVASYINTNYIIPGVPFTDVRENLQPLNDFGLMLGIYGLITAAVESISKGTKWLNGEGTGNVSDDIKFGSDTKSSTKLNNQMNQRGWSEQSVKNTVDNPHTTRTSTNLSTGNASTVYYTKDGAYVIIDNITKEVVQISDALNPASWIPDANIIDPFLP